MEKQPSRSHPYDAAVMLGHHRLTEPNFNRAMQSAYNILEPSGIRIFDRFDAEKYREFL